MKVADLQILIELRGYRSFPSSYIPADARAITKYSYQRRFKTTEGVGSKFVEIYIHEATKASPVRPYVNAEMVVQAERDDGSWFKLLLYGHGDLDNFANKLDSLEQDAEAVFQLLQGKQEK